MECDFLTLKPIEASTSLIPCALRLKAPETVDRIPTHIILLLDVSESMMTDDKLENVKVCSELILNFLTDHDHVSLITFGEKATLHLKRVVADSLHKDSIKNVIKNLYCDGCTNLSAGLGYVREVCSGETQKTGLLILTDGHANRGIHLPEDLRNLVKSIKSSNTNLSIHCVAYGTDHNADLLKSIAEDCQGSYNIVNTVEDTAIAFGDTLGGLVSCAFQNVYIEVPDSTVVHGPHKIENKQIYIGDVYSGTKPLFLFDVPIGNLTSVQVKGMQLPAFEPFILHPVPYSEDIRQLDIELTMLRYTCSSILQDIKEWNNLSMNKRSAISDRIVDFEIKIRDPFYNGSPIAVLLRNEVSTLRNLLETAQRGNMNHGNTSLVSQHITSIGLGRGFSSPIAPTRRRQRQMNQVEELEDPYDDQGSHPPMDPVLSSAFQNNVQTRISELLRTASQQPR